MTDRKTKAADAAESRSYLGTGWNFPPGFIKGIGAELVSGEADIRQSLVLLFSTRVAERLMRFDYGCSVSQWVFSGMTLSEKTLIADAVEQAILYHEPRIRVESVRVELKEPSEGVVWIEVSYRILQTNSRSNMVYPFYFREGTNL